jgi:2-keto-4-pentenoate hydratase
VLDEMPEHPVEALLFFAHDLRELGVCGVGNGVVLGRHCGASVKGPAHAVACQTNAGA